jgi:hypothetical protein
MTVRSAKLHGQNHAVLPISAYERLIALAEGRVDVLAAEAGEKRRLAGEEYLPSHVVDRALADPRSFQD